MGGLRGNTDGKLPEGMPERQLDGGQGVFSTIGEKLGKIPGLRTAIKTGAMLGVLVEAASLEGCMPDNNTSNSAVGAEKGHQGYSVLKAALTVDEMKALTTPTKVAGTEIGDSAPEFGEIDGKKVMFIAKGDPAIDKVSIYFKAGSTLKELMTQGVFTEVKGLSGNTIRVTVCKNKAYLRKAFGVISEADIKFNANNELEVSNTQELNDIAEDDIKVVEIGGVPYLYGGSSSWTASRKNLTTGVVEELPKANYEGGIPAYHNGTWIGNRFVKSGGVDVLRAYSAATFEGVATSSTPVSKLNQGIQANTGDIAIAEDDERVVVVEAKWNAGNPTTIYYSEFLKPQQPNPEPAQDAGSTDTVDGGTSGTDTAEVAEDAGAELPPPPADDPVDAGSELPPPQDADTVDGGTPGTDAAAEVAEDAAAELPPPQDTGSELPPPPADDPVDAGAPQSEPNPEPTPDSGTTEIAQTNDVDAGAGEVADDIFVAPEVNPNKDIDAILAEIDAAAEIAAADASENQDQAPDAPKSEDTTVLPQDSGNKTPDSGNRAPDTSSGSPEIKSADGGINGSEIKQQADVGSNHPGDNTDCSANPTSRKGVEGLLAGFAMMVSAVYSRRKK